jgi:spore germination protein
MTHFFHNRRAAVRTVSFLTAAFLVVTGLAIQSHRRADTYHRYLQYGYHHAFAELTTAVEELDTALQKGVYATSPALLSPLYTQIYGKAMSAQMALGELPFSHIELEQTAAFVAKIGDYAMALARSTAQNGGASQEDHETLKALSQSASQLSQTLQDLQGDLYSGALALEDITAAEARLAQSQGETGAETAGSTFQDVEADFPEVPSLIYDGPFSEHLSGRTPLALEGLPQVGMDEARTAAAQFLGVKPELFSLASTGEGSLPTWGFSAGLEGGDLYLEVTRQGGQVLQLFTSRPIGDAVLTREEGLEAARDFLVQRGYPAMRESYSMLQGNVLTVNFAALEGEVVCYPDLVKVSIALDNGGVVGFEAQGYLTNHRPRSVAPAACPEETARQKLSPELTVLSHQMAIIPTAGSYEVYCHEFKCQSPEGQHVIVYLNGDTGAEEKILLLLEDENGTLAL